MPGFLGQHPAQLHRDLCLFLCSVAGVLAFFICLNKQGAPHCYWGVGPTVGIAVGYSFWDFAREQEIQSPQFLLSKHILPNVLRDYTGILTK